MNLKSKHNQVCFKIEDLIDKQECLSLIYFIDNDIELEKEDTYIEYKFYQYKLIM